MYKLLAEIEEEYGIPANAMRVAIKRDKDKPAKERSYDFQVKKYGSVLKIDDETRGFRSYLTQFSSGKTKLGGISHNTRKGITISLCNQKGGAAKTTTAAALASIYGEQGLKVLVVDNDPQGNLSLQFGIDCLTQPNLPGTVSDLYLGKATPNKIAIPTRFRGVSLIPASVDSAAVEITLPTLPGGDLLLGMALEADKSNYDLIILDSPPNLGKFTINVVNASDYYMVPVDGPWGLRSVDTFLKLARQNALIYKLPTQLLGVFMTMVSRTRIMSNVREEIIQRFPNHYFKSEIRRSTLAQEAAALETPLPLYATDSGVALDYRALAEEVAVRIGLTDPIVVEEAAVVATLEDQNLMVASASSGVKKAVK